MKVLTIGSDRKLFEENSDVRRRIIEYGALFEEMHIIVFSKYNANDANRMRMMRIAENVWLYPTNSRNRFLYIVDAYRIGKRIIKNWKLEIKHSVATAQDPFEAGLVGWLLKRATGIALQLQVHTDFLSPYFKKESLLNRVRVNIALFLLPKSDCIRVVSKRIKNSLESKIPPPTSPGTGNQESKISIIPIFVDVEKIKNTPVTTDLHKKYPGHDYIVFMMSRFTKEKNIPMAIDIMAELKNIYPGMLLVIVGEGPEKKNFESYIKSRALEEHVIIEQWANDSISYYKSADVFLLLSHYEGYGRTAIEAMAAGCPVIMTDVGIARYIVQHGRHGLVIPVGDKRACKQAMIGMYGSVEERKQFSLHAKEDVEKYIYTSKQEYVQVYKKSLEQCAS